MTVLVLKVSEEVTWAPPRWLSKALYFYLQKILWEICLDLLVLKTAELVYISPYADVSGATAIIKQYVELKSICVCAS